LLSLASSAVTATYDAPNGTMNEWNSDITVENAGKSERQNVTLDSLVLSVRLAFRSSCARPRTYFGFC
jgi:hypothetical protein